MALGQMANCLTWQSHPNTGQPGECTHVAANPPPQAALLSLFCSPWHLSASTMVFQCRPCTERAIKSCISVLGNCCSNKLLAKVSAYWQTTVLEGCHFSLLTDHCARRLPLQPQLQKPLQSRFSERLTRLLPVLVAISYLMWAAPNHTISWRNKQTYLIFQVQPFACGLKTNPNIEPTKEMIISPNNFFRGRRVKKISLLLRGSILAVLSSLGYILLCCLLIVSSVWCISGS